MRTLHFEGKEYILEPMGLQERFSMLKKYKGIEKGDIDIEQLEQIYDELITLISKKTKNQLTKEEIIKVVNVDALKGDELIANFMASMAGDVSKKN